MFRKPYFWIVVWFVVLLLGPLTVFKDTPWRVAIAHPTTLSNFLQRIVAVLAFTMIFFQIVLGSFMPKLIEKLGGWVFKFHTIEGPIAYLLVFAHPLLFVAFNYFSRSVIDPFYVFTDFCLLCQTRLEFFYTLGRIAFWFVSLAVLAALVRIQPWWRDHWGKFHILSYFVFYLLAFHSWYSGTDTTFAPFVYFYWFAVLVVSAISLGKLWSILLARRGH